MEFFFKVLLPNPLLYLNDARQHEEMIALLLRSGANPGKEVGPFPESDSPLKLAERRDYARITARLRRNIDQRNPGPRLSTSRL